MKKLFILLFVLIPAFAFANKNDLTFINVEKFLNGGNYIRLCYNNDHIEYKNKSGIIKIDVDGDSLYIYEFDTHFNGMKIIKTTFDMKVYKTQIDNNNNLWLSKN